MKFSFSFYILTFALLYELYVPLPAATTTTEQTQKTRRTRTTRARYTFDGVDYHEFLGKHTSSANLDCSTRFLKCYLYTPLHWEVCMLDVQSEKYYDVFSVCQIDFMNCQEMRLKNKPYVRNQSHYKTFQGYGHKCKMSRGQLNMWPWWRRVPNID